MTAHPELLLLDGTAMLFRAFFSGFRSQSAGGVEVGGVVINDVPSYRVDNMPYGGVKDSGLGREGIKFAMDDMTEIRNLVIRRG